MENIFAEVEVLRKSLHQIAELSGKEFRTAELINAELIKCNPDELHTEIGTTGIVATFDSNEPGQHIVFRSELDALPIQEINTFSHRSDTDGVSHKCGHDGHMSILMGLAKFLSLNRPMKGKVSLLFQPAEENGQGAEAMIRSGRISDFEPIDKFYSLHNIPGHEQHTIYCRSGVFTPHVISLEIKLHGKESHAAEPENGHNPALAIAEITQSFHDLQQLDKSRSDFKLITPVFSKMGKVWYGISAGEAELGFTIRTWETRVMRELQDKCLKVVEAIAKKYQLGVETRYFEEFNSTMNDEHSAGQIKKAAEANQFQYVEMSYPMNWGEDYGLFTQKYKGAMFGLGSGQNIPALHNPDYDFPDVIAATGIKMFIQILKEEGLLSA